VQCQDQLFRGGEGNLTLIFGFVYHVMNNTCIHEWTEARIYT
jgi:hypothetical protein